LLKVKPKTPKRANAGCALMIRKMKKKTISARIDRATPNRIRRSA
jgi:hypothetical protein